MPWCFPLSLPFRVEREAAALGPAYASTGTPRRRLVGDLGVLDGGEVEEVAPLAVQVGRGGPLGGVAREAAHDAVPQRAQLPRLVLLHAVCYFSHR